MARDESGYEDEPTRSVALPYQPGAVRPDPRSVNRDPRYPGGDPRPVARDRRDIDRDPRSSGGDPRQGGRDPYQEGWDPGGGARDPAAGRRAPRPETGGRRGGRSPEEEPDGRGRLRRGLRYRVLPRTLLGTTAFILAFALGAGFSGVVLYSYYQYRLNETDARVNTLINGYQKQFAQANQDLANATNKAEGQIRSELTPLENLQGNPAAEAALIKKVAPSTFFVHTLDSTGEASVGSAFVITSNSTQSLLLTSYTTIAAATHSPAPPVYIEQGTVNTQVTVTTWDQATDLALIVLPKGHLPALPAAPISPAPSVGEKVYAISGLGSAGASISEGAISDVGAAGLADTASIGPQFQGGPIVDSAGAVLAVASRTFAPLGFTPDGVLYAPYLQAACTKVLTCPNGSFPVAG